MAYKAVDIARKMVQLSIDNKLWITNLKLQKILYFTWRDYYEKFGERLFDDDKFQAWRYGPVVPSVYYEYWTNVSSLIFITNPPDDEIDATVSEFLLDKLRKYKDTPASQLVDESHREGTPWSIYHKKGDKTEIPFESIEESTWRGSAT